MKNSESSAHASNAVGLYLPGEFDLDRKHAIKNGFRPYNMIGVDSEISVVKAMRKRGNICIHADLMDVILAWPKSTPLQFINADFCGGFNRTSMRMNEVLLSDSMVGNKHPTVICVNMLRGRDNDSRFYREIAQEARFGSAGYLVNNKPADSRTMLMHRGIHLYLWLVGEMCEWWRADFSDENPGSMDDYIDIFGYDMALNARPVFRSYQARTTIMDSVTFKWWWSDFTTIKNNDTKTLNKIKAALAVRSMKMNGTVRQAAIA